MNPESCTRQVLYPQTTRDNALGGWACRQGCIFRHKQKPFPKAERKLQTSGFISPIFRLQILSSLICEDT